MALPSASRPKLAFAIRADCAPAGCASSAAASAAKIAQTAARWSRVDLPMSRKMLPPRERGWGDSRPPGLEAAPGRDCRAGLEDLEAGAGVERVGRAGQGLD